MTRVFVLVLFSVSWTLSLAQENNSNTQVYKKRVLESIEVDFLSSYYTQDGDNAAVSGGIGTESLQDATGAIVISIPLSEDELLTIDAGVSAYTSASSSNINPFDARSPADPFIASSGESKSDLWSSGNISYSHSSDDRNAIWSSSLSFSTEYDYQSLGGGASFTKLFNEKNTAFSIKGNVFIDTWKLIYPIELRAPGNGNEDDDEDNFNIANYTITGNQDYQPLFESLNGKNRNSYSLGLGFSQILSKNLQASFAFDVVLQEGQLSTPFQRVYFSDIEDSFIENFHLADDIERLPSSRLKTALGARLNYYINEFLSLRTFFRYYLDDWGIQSKTASIELPIKLFEGKITLYPSYRYYDQLAADCFKPYNAHLSTDEFYTSDYDLSNYESHQIGFGISYSDAFNIANLWKIGLKSVDLKYYKYDRNTSFSSHLVTLGVKFVLE